MSMLDSNGPADEAARAPTAVVKPPTHEDPNHRLMDGIALCLSGGGYRAMLFHLGTLARLNDVGLLCQIHRFSSVSGGSITSAYLGIKWAELQFSEDGVAKNFHEVVVKPIAELGFSTALAETSSLYIIWDRIVKGSWWFSSYEHGAANVLNTYLNQQLFKDATLMDLPDKGAGPEFYINATNLATANLFIFTHRYLGESELGYLLRRPFPISKAVVASAGFPPLISPVCIQTKGAPWMGDAKWSRSTHKDGVKYVPNIRVKGNNVVTRDLADVGCGLIGLTEEEYERKVAEVRSPSLYLGDGGIYDNMGVETAFRKFRTILVSDAGQYLQFEKDHKILGLFKTNPPVKEFKPPAREYIAHGIQTSQILDHQVRILRKRQLTAAFKEPRTSALHRNGVYWSIRGDASTDGRGNREQFKAHPSGRGNEEKHNTDLDRSYVNDWSKTRTADLAGVDTALSGLDQSTIWGLIDWGYVRTASAIQTYYQDPEDKNLTAALYRRDIKKRYVANAPIKLPSKLR